MMVMRRERWFVWKGVVVAGVVVVGVALGSGAWGQSGEGPSLDELLGLPSSSGEAGEATEDGGEVEGSGGDAAAEGAGAGDGEDAGDSGDGGEAATAVELDPEVARRLRGEAMEGNPFESALVDMTEAAERLGKSQDAGLKTQRLMQRVLDKLDRAIASAKQQQGGGGGSSGEPSERGEDSGGQQMAQQGSQGQRSGAAGSASPSEGGSGHSGEASPGAVGPGGEDADEPLAESRREWGSLPPRVRRELTEGVNERISPLYRRLTERYFEVLSEEP